MTETEARGYLLDTTALPALGSSRRVSMLIATAPHSHLPMYAPVSCVDAADRIRPDIARHVGRISAVEPIDLTYSSVLDLRAHPADGAGRSACDQPRSPEPRLVRRADRGHRQT